MLAVAPVRTLRQIFAGAAVTSGPGAPGALAHNARVAVEAVVRRTGLILAPAALAVMASFTNFATKGGGPWVQRIRPLACTRRRA